MIIRTVFQIYGLIQKIEETFDQEEITKIGGDIVELKKMLINSPTSKGAPYCSDEVKKLTV